MVLSVCYEGDINVHFLLLCFGEDKTPSVCWLDSKDFKL